MPNQRGGTDPAERFFRLDEDERGILDQARVPIDVSGPPNETVKSRGNRLMSGYFTARAARLMSRR
jgi:hypothetical protein